MSHGEAKKCDNEFDIVLEDSSTVKHLPSKYEDLTLDPQGPLKDG